MSYDQSKVAFVDTETTGLDPELHTIWEVAVIVDGVEHVWLQQLPVRRVRGEAPADVIDWDRVSPWVIDNTGIRDRYDDTAALTPSESFHKMVDLVRGRHLIGACTWFDSERLQRVDLKWNAPLSFERGLKWHYHLIDVENLAVGYIRGMRHAHRQITEHGYPAEFDDHGFDEMALPWKSTELSLALGVDPDDFQPKHTALTDARWAKAMYEAMMGDPT